MFILFLILRCYFCLGRRGQHGPLLMMILYILKYPRVFPGNSSERKWGGGCKRSISSGFAAQLGLDSLSVHSKSSFFNFYFFTPTVVSLPTTYIPAPEGRKGVFPVDHTEGTQWCLVVEVLITVSTLRVYHSINKSSQSVWELQQAGTGLFCSLLYWHLTDSGT